MSGRVEELETGISAKSGNRPRIRGEEV